MGTVSYDYRELCIAAKGDECILGDHPKREVIVHHIDGNRANGALDNLIPVCYSCHMKIHHGSEGYEDYHERLRPFSRFNFTEETTTITLRKSLHEAFSRLKGDSQPWEDFMLELFEAYTADPRISADVSTELSRSDADKIAEQVVDRISAEKRQSTLPITLTRGTINDVSDSVSSRVVRDLRDY